MTLLTKTISYIKYKRKGMRKAFKLAYDGKLSAGDYYCAVMLLCIVGILLTLRFADYIDGLNSHAENMRSAAEYMQAEAIRREDVIVSMLNGSVMINGRIVTLCKLSAAGDCKR